MKALTFTGIQSITYESIPDAVIEQTTDVIIKMDCCAICGSDLHVFHGRESGIDMHTAMGHEFAGEIIELGKDVKSFQKGDKVVSPFTTACGVCFYCLRGLSARCVHNQIYGWVENGIGLQGAQAEFIRVPLADTTLMKYSNYDLMPHEALLSGDIFSTGYFGALLCEIKPGDQIAVIGCGPVGLMAIFGASLMSASAVYSIDQVSDRLAVASSFNGIPMKSDSDLLKKILDLTQGRGVDAVIEAVGNESAQRLAFDLVRPGGIISTIGVHTTDSFVFKPADVYNKNVTYKSGRCPARSLMTTTLPLIVKHKTVLNTLFTHRFPLAEGSKAYDIFDQKKESCLKVLMT
ncbi:MAG: alcohol dehydrogenase catalytic domain-containing protein [Saprospiraceae bacterium]